MAQLKGSYIYVEDIYDTAEIPAKRFSSLKQAVKYIYSAADKGSKDLLLCVGNYNLDYPRYAESLEDYYKRMRKMFHEIFDQPYMR